MYFEKILQPSQIRIYPDDAFSQNGAIVDEDLSKANTIFAVKEIPVDLLATGKTYIFFSHTIKGQAYNKGLLKRLMELKCNLIDYERIVNEKNQRLIFFSTHAGYAGMIETLSGEFELQDYYDHPEKYESIIEQHLSKIDILVNCIFWTEKYPRLVTKDYLKAQAVSHADSNLSVTGDISCDIEGSIEITKESSMFFSNILKAFADDIISADFGKSFDELDLPYPIKKALILHNGQLTTDYRYMEILYNQ
jgi:alanine dehydrogenase